LETLDSLEFRGFCGGVVNFQILSPRSLLLKSITCLR
jgi:hypothetical protein